MMRSSHVLVALLATMPLILSSLTEAQTCSGNALSLDGDPGGGMDDIVLVPDSDSLDLTGDFTLEVWVLLTSPQTSTLFTSKFIAKGGTSGSSFDFNYGLTILNSTDTPVFGVGNGGQADIVFGSENLRTGQWVHVAAVRSGMQLRLFVNGAPDGVLNGVVPTPSANSAPLCIGSLADAFDSSLTGSMDEIRVWNIARTQCEILATMNDNLPGSTPGLVGYWQMNESIGDQPVFDSTPFHNDGMLGDTASPDPRDPTRLASSVLIDCASNPMAQFCLPGQAGIIPCPCGNPPAGAGLGCDNFGPGSIAGGATLDATGTASLTADSPLPSVRLHATGENENVLTVFWTGRSQLSPGVAHGSGVRCVTNSLERLWFPPAVPAPCGMISMPRGTDRSVSLETQFQEGAPITPGQTRHYFCTYRDQHAAAPCGNTASTINLTNAGEITWSP